MDSFAKWERTNLRFYFSQVRSYKVVLTNEQMGRLFFAVADYAMTGEKKTVDMDIQYPYNEYCAFIDRHKANMAVD